MLMMSFILSISFIFLNHPMTMGMVLLMQTITVALITGMLNMNFWFSYILFLIMVGGMLILFIYMTSIASNEMFSYSNKMMFNWILFSIIMIFNMMMNDYYFINMNYSYMENLTLNTNLYSLTKYFNYPSMLLIFMMIIYLFITLVAAVKITKIEYGPLRHKF